MSATAASARVHTRFIVCSFGDEPLANRISKISKLIIIAVLACVGLFFLVGLLNYDRFNPPLKSDFAQDYFLARAVVSGIDPYLPLHELGVQFGVPNQISHSSTHPPSFAVLCLPLALLSFQQAAFIWLVLGLISLLLSLHLLFGVKGIGLPVICLAAIAWPPVLFDLALGQLMLPQLLLLTLAWLALRSQKDMLGGMLLGLTISIKLIAWPLLIFLLIRKRFKAALSGCGIFALMNLIALMLMGIEPVTTYYLHRSREITAIYSNNVFNFSAWTTGARLFAGTKAVDAPWFHTLPLVDAAALVPLTSIVCVIGVLVYGFFVALKAQSFDASFAVLVNTAVIVSPVAWVFYLTLVLLSIAILRNVNDWKTRAKIGLCLIAPLVSQSVLPIFGSSSSVAIALLMLVPLLAIVLLITAHAYHDRLVSKDPALPLG
jgi:hypothetical protein